MRTVVRASFVALVSLLTVASNMLAASSAPQTPAPPIPPGFERAHGEVCSGPAGERGRACVHGHERADFETEAAGPSDPPEYHNIPTTGNYPETPCYGTTGEEGKRFSAIYMYPSGGTNDIANKKAGIRESIDYADWWTNKSADMSNSTEGNGPYQHTRWQCNMSYNQVRITEVKGVAVSDTFSYNYGTDGIWGTNDDTCTKTTATDTTYHYLDVWCSLKQQTGLGLGTVNYDRTDRFYAVFLDLPSSKLNYSCFWGWVRDDTTPDPAMNKNNVGPNHLQMACPSTNGWTSDGASVMHEMGHNMGAVQLTAPHATNGHHCTDNYDRMCYNDGQLKTGTSMQTLCTNSNREQEFDCQDDDYYSPQNRYPTSHTYWRQQWNISSSSFLTGLF